MKCPVALIVTITKYESEPPEQQRRASLRFRSGQLRYMSGMPHWPVPVRLAATPELGNPAALTRTRTVLTQGVRGVVTPGRHRGHDPARDGEVVEDRVGAGLLEFGGP